MNNTENQKFIKLLEEIQKQNKSGFALQAFQVKYQREIAGEDDDQREKQLDTLIDSTDKSTDHLQEIKKLTEKIETALTGVQKNTGVISKKLTADLETKLTSFKADSDKTIRESLKETISAVKSTTSSLGKGLKTAFSVGKGLLTNPKEVLAGAGSRIGNIAKEKIGAAGGYLADIAKTEEGYTAEKERFAKEYVRQQQSRGMEGTEEELLKQGKEKYTQIVKGEEELKKVEESITKSKEQGFEPLPEDVAKKQKIIEEINAARGGIPAEAAVTSVGRMPGVEAKPEPGPGVAGINPEADNVTSAQEAIAETAKLDLDLTKETNKILEDQLSELQKISTALTPKTPSELPEQKSTEVKKGGKNGEGDSEGEGGGFGLGDALSKAGGLGKKAGGALVKGAKAAGKGALALGKGVATFAGSTAGKALGAAAAVGMGAYTAYQGYTAAEDSKQAKLEEVQAKVNSGELSPEQAAAARKEIGNTATVEKSGAVGEGTGMAAGAIGGAKLGAALGSFAGPIGTGVGLLAGGAIGAFAGSKVGKAVGEKFGGAVNTVKGWFGGGEKPTEIPATESTPAAPTTLETAPGPSQETTDPTGMGDDSEYKKVDTGSLRQGEKGLKAQAADWAKQSKATPMEARASGGPVAKGEPYIVGEQGPEVFIPTEGGKISSSKATTIDLGEGMTKKTNPDGSYEISGGFGIKKYDKAGNLISEVSPRFGGYQTETGAGGLTERYTGDNISVSQTSAGGQVTSKSASAQLGQYVFETSDQNASMRDLGQPNSQSQPIISNSVSNVNNTSYVPIKPSPRADYSGSAIDRYNNRISVY